MKFSLGSFVFALSVGAERVGEGRQRVVYCSYMLLAIVVVRYCCCCCCGAIKDADLLRVICIKVAAASRFRCVFQFQLHAERRATPFSKLESQ